MAKLTFFLLPFAFFHLSSSDGPSLNVVSFGANGDGVTDSTQAFLSAWESACNMSIPSEIYVPMGNYLLNPVTFKGDCMGPHLTMTINGTLVGPTDYNLIAQAASWIEFHGVDGLSINGGLLDARGQYLWDCKANGGDCPFGGRSLSLGNSNNVVITNLTSINSQMFHVSINECQNVTLLGLTIWADGDSPNTDGIHIENSIGLNILHSPIQTGDDCISAGPGTQNLWIEDVSCGPGHGISIGSLGAEEDEEGVRNVTAKNVSFNGTENGLRIKTWARPSNAFVQDVHFEGGVMYNVSNPIIIDQNYCPSRNCAYDQASGVKISNVTYRGIHGTTVSAIAMRFNCSPENPCTGLLLEDVQLTGGSEWPQSLCENAYGLAIGSVQPESCLQLLINP